MVSRIGWKSLVLAGVLGVAAIGGLSASPFGEGSPGPMFGGQFGKSPIARLMMGRLGRMMALRSDLNLSSEQEQKLKGIMQSHKGEAITIAQGIHAKRDVLREAVLADQPDEAAIRKAAEELGREIGTAAVAASKVAGEAKLVLSKEQKELVRKFIAEQDAATDRFLTQLK